MERILVTGCAGFIGFHLCKRLLEEGCTIFGVDSMNSYYSVALKKDRLNILESNKKFSFKKIDIADYPSLKKHLLSIKFDKIVNLAAQAGVRYSLSNPHSYIDSNIKGFMNILEISRQLEIKGLVFASSSSTYGLKSNAEPISEKNCTDEPISIYGATKKANELMAHSYHSLYGLKATGLRFFSVYGPWGRPDMAIYKFTKNILLGKEIKVYNKGNMSRDFTFISDIVDGIKLALEKNFGFEIFNLGRSIPINLIDLIRMLEKILNKKAIINYSSMQLGDVKNTCADISHAKNKLGYNPKVGINNGLKSFTDWFISKKN